MLTLRFAWRPRPQRTMQFGGGIYFGGSGPVQSCFFLSNTGQCVEKHLNVSDFPAITPTGGGGIYFWGSGTVQSCSFLSNSASSVSDLAAGRASTVWLWSRWSVPSAMLTLRFA